jgi:predicted DCC family thiol-disulfide oxidoreductase YuxK
MLKQAWLIYDAECPFCGAFVRRTRLRKNVDLHLIDARSEHPLIQTVIDRGLDLNEGMVLKTGNNYYHGADCIHVLALMSNRSDCFNRINSMIFASPALARILYPVLRAGRKTILTLLGRKPLIFTLNEHRN